MEPQSIVAQYEDAIAELLRRRADNDLPEDVEERLMEVLETAWEKMTPDQRGQADAWVRARMTARPRAEE